MEWLQTVAMEKYYKPTGMETTGGLHFQRIIGTGFVFVFMDVCVCSYLHAKVVHGSVSATTVLSCCAGCVLVHGSVSAASTTMLLSVVVTQLQMYVT